MVVQIPNHAHCWICGKAIQAGEKTCSAECQAKVDLQQRKRKQLMWLMYGAMGLFIIMLIMQLLGYGG